MTDRERWEEIRNEITGRTIYGQPSQSAERAWFDEACKRLAAQEQELERLRQERRDALSVHTKEGLLASEWVLRTGKAERELAEAERQHLDMADEQERYSDALSAAHVALGGDGEWVAKPGSVCAAGETGDLAIDVPALAESVVRELAEARRRVESLEDVLRSVQRATVFFCRSPETPWSKVDEVLAGQ